MGTPNRILPIHHTFGPLADTRQRSLARRLLCAPWKWRQGKSIQELRRAIRSRFGMEVTLFASGRQALLAMLHTMKLKQSDEIIVQGYTCIVVPNAIITAGATPVYVDIEKDTLNLDIEEVRKAITPRTKAIICQHTFGIPADTQALRELCDTHKLMLIEDCAHVIPDRDGPKEIGKHGDFLLLSFGRDKAISGVAGGAALCKSPVAAQMLKKSEDNAKHLSLWTIKRLLLYPLLYGLGRSLYPIRLGKPFLYASRLSRFLLPIVTEGEKRGKMPAKLQKLPNACAALAFDQWKRVQHLNDHRRRMNRFYLKSCARHGWSVLHGIQSNLPLQKFPIFIKNAAHIRRALKKHNIHLDDGWTGCVVCPASTDASCAQYKEGSDPNAEEVSEQILSLPTHPTMTEEQAKKLVAHLSTLLK